MSVRAYRKQVYDVLESSDPAEPSSNLIATALQVLIALNVVAVVLESVPSIHRTYGHALNVFETASIGVFTAEYLFRLWCIVDSDDPKFGHRVMGRIRFMFTPFALIDMLVLLPAYIGLFGGIDIRTLRVLRLLRLLKLARYSRSMFLLWDVICEEARAIGASAFVLGMLLILASSVAYLFEHPAQPEAFSSIPQAMWWAIVTMTTVGYGDVTPVTIAGKIIAAIVSIVGIGMVALPAGLIAAGFVNRLHGGATTPESAPEPPPAPEVNAGYLEHIMAKLEEGLRELSLAEQIGGSDPAETDRCPTCGAPLSGESVRGHGDPSTTAQRNHAGG